MQDDAKNPAVITEAELDSATGGGAKNMNKLFWDDALAATSTDEGSETRSSSGHYTQVVWADTR